MAILSLLPRLRFAAAALLLLLAGPPLARAGDTASAYDLLGRVLVPWISILADRPAGEDRALAVTLRVEADKGFPVSLVGQRAEVALQYPDKLRLSVPFYGQEFTIARRGETLWVYPGSQLRALLARPEVAQRLPAPNRKFHLKPFQLPVPAKDLVFLPALFSAKELPGQTVEGVACRVLDLRLNALLANSFDLGDWSARLWVEAKDEAPVRIEVSGPATSATLRFEKVAFSPSLPAETWVPGKDQEGDVVIVPPVRYDQLLRALLGAK